jgi:hypothetical protein
VILHYKTGKITLSPPLELCSVERMIRLVREINGSTEQSSAGAISIVQFVD